jgi:hypothetical protein
LPFQIQLNAPYCILSLLFYITQYHTPVQTLLLTLYQYNEITTYLLSPLHSHYYYYYLPVPSSELSNPGGKPTVLLLREREGSLAFFHWQGYFLYNITHHCQHASSISNQFTGSGSDGGSVVLCDE